MVAIGARSIWEPAVIGLIGGVFGCMEEQQGRLAPSEERTDPVVADDQNRPVDWLDSPRRHSR
jgi:hypothetical protein